MIKRTGTRIDCTLGGNIEKINFLRRYRPRYPSPSIPESLNSRRRRRNSDGDRSPKCSSYMSTGNRLHAERITPLLHQHNPQFHRCQSTVPSSVFLVPPASQYRYIYTYRPYCIRCIQACVFHPHHQIFSRLPGVLCSLYRSRFSFPLPTPEPLLQAKNVKVSQGNYLFAVDRYVTELITLVAYHIEF